MTIRDSIKKSIKVKESKNINERYIDDWYYGLSKEEQEQVDHLLDIYYGKGTMLDDLESDECDELMDRFEMMKESRQKHESKKDKKDKKSCEECDKTIKEGKLHPFTKNDWYGWAGAERFPDGSDPYIYEDPDTGNTVIVSYDSYSDDIVVEVDIWGEDEDVAGYSKSYQGDLKKALVDAESLISSGALSSGELGDGWEQVAG